MKINGLEAMAKCWLVLSTKGRDPVNVTEQSNQKGVAEFRTALDAPQTVYQGTLQQIGEAR